VVLAVVIVPLAVITLTRALNGRYAKHRIIARWTWPLWMYVSITGVIVYFMLYQWFPHS
jgi:putative membrane protein